MTIILFLYSDLKQFFIGDEFESNEFLVYVLCPTFSESLYQLAFSIIVQLRPFGGSPRIYFTFGLFITIVIRYLLISNLSFEQPAL